MSRLLIIGGTDSSGGAGLTRDTAVATSFGLAVCPVVTAVTAQTGGRLHSAFAIAPDLIRAQIETALSGGQVRGVKIGMLGNEATVEVVAETLRDRNLPVVLDSVLRSTSGGTLLSETGTQALLQDLLAITTLVTPNLEELASLSGLPGAPIAEQVKALQAAAVLVKGGHGSGAFSTDTLWHAGATREFSAPRLKVLRRGTGCSLATAIACCLAQGLSLEDSCANARTWIQSWLSQ
jgi:hydroxymethylpyrimidine/phosphomethylpyrimidine kinase